MCFHTFNVEIWWIVLGGQQGDCGRGKDVVDDVTWNDVIRVWMTSRCEITENMRNRCVFMIFIKWNETLWWILNVCKRCVVFSLLLIDPEIPDCHIRLSGFLEKNRFSSKFYRVNIRCSRENRINGFDKADLTIRISFSNFKWHPLIPLIYKFLTEMQKNGFEPLFSLFFNKNYSNWIMCMTFTRLVRGKGRC